tara:strand:+ start:140 stop:673 length:534 start_codon:yes stop_codon:yes gene_type:complete
MIAKLKSRLGIEVWKDIPEYEGLYQVSNLGNVRSLDRVSSKGRKVKGKVLKGAICGSPYFRVNLYKDNKIKLKNIHQLVAIAFLKHTPCGHKLVVNHIDINPKNNNLYNLEVITQRENCNKKHIKSSSKYIGVYWENSSNKWRSSIRINGKAKHLGLFTDEKEAAQAYQNELNKIKL